MRVWELDPIAARRIADRDLGVGEAEWFGDSVEWSELELILDSRLNVPRREPFVVSLCALPLPLCGGLPISGLSPSVMRRFEGSLRRLT